MSRSWWLDNRRGNQLTQHTQKNLKLFGPFFQHLFSRLFFLSLSVWLVLLKFLQRTLTYFVRGSISVQLTSCLTGLNSAALLMLNQIQLFKFGRIQTSKIGGQPYSVTSPYEVSECSLVSGLFCLFG